jgi:hypothetical protein
MKINNINVRVIRILNIFSPMSRFIAKSRRGRPENKAIMKARCIGKYDVCREFDTRS